ncbi:biofilm regulation diguanylate cyclase SiaD [Caballeronia mineralivorans]|jgi:diguanylate cyclase (GGDEF)-like protein|uniref:biofilm regulation diguanylate cyclase SiaD n=1 Tax=Caballeronia mineralivorans TaxID=2010198 RepID=UPI0023F593E4|nr:biofilm regulation diguanylate cyclase SiaD [Caballeronia mineralivorans]MDB5789234.1 Diguanylate cyclase [Caballeronia mineralivorans]MEA3100396.1 diguanylate cyclase [Caballeronia mineralivorans]
MNKTRPVIKRDHFALEKHVQALLAESAASPSDLSEALAQLWEHYGEQLARLERITRLSDAYQSLAREQDNSLVARFDKQLRQLQKVARISDRYQKMMVELNLALKEASTHDPLTGLPNRRLLMERLKVEVEHASRHREPFVVAIVDVDHFKQVNDTYGHEAGDTVLQEVARFMTSQMREYDVCGRWGGEEFLALLPKSTLDSALSVIGRIHQGIPEHSMDVGGQAVSITVSIGVAEHRAGEEWEGTLQRADALLLKAKREGRNRALGE